MDKRIRALDNGLVYTSDQETLVIEPWGRDGLRVRVTPLPEIIDKPWALTEPVDAQANIEICDAEATIRNGNVSARIRDIYTQNGHLEFYKHTEDKMIPMLSEYDYGVHATTPAHAGSSPWTMVFSSPNCISLHGMENASTVWARTPLADLI